MRILLTNDDGLRAPGIEALHAEMLQLGEVFTVAPLEVQSATSHSVTFNVPLMARQMRINDRMSGFAIDGRPADCVKLAIENVWPEHHPQHPRPDLVVSGMNMGCNVGIHVIYSGTVGAAIEAAFLGLPSIAVSLYVAGELKKRGFEDVRWDVAARHARHAIERCLEHGLPEPHSVLNINIPSTTEDGPLPPIKVVPMNLAGMADRYERRVSPNGQVYYWSSGDGMAFHHTATGSDVEALLAGNITITPLHFDLTDHTRLRMWQQRLGNSEPRHEGCPAT